MPPGATGGRFPRLPARSPMSCRRRPMLPCLYSITQHRTIPTAPPNAVLPLHRRLHSLVLSLLVVASMSEAAASLPGLTSRISTIHLPKTLPAATSIWIEIVLWVLAGVNSTGCHLHPKRVLGRHTGDAGLTRKLASATFIEAKKSWSFRSPPNISILKYGDIIMTRSTVGSMGIFRMCQK
ncbi:hypothetical protein ZWY2020_006400 [Hordeum vulgare]|nr:hypothetical protein ZWY2020_006400 [Hordeum vulgare]